MKIVLLTLNFAPELTGIGKYSGEMAAELVRRGHEVSVVCAPPYYPAWRVGDGYDAGSYQTERPTPGLTIHRCPIWIPARPTGLRRILHLASFALSSLPVLLKLVGWRPQIVFVVAPALFCAPAGWLTARLSGARAWLHIQDFEIDAAYQLGLLRQPLLRSGALAVERLLMRSFDTVSTISRRMMRQFATKGIALHQTALLPNWVDLSQVRPTGRSPALRAALGIGEDRLVCLYSGTLNRKQGLGVIVDTARLMQEQPELLFVICGNGELRGSLEDAARDLPNVRFLDLQPTSELNALLNMADIHLLPQLRGAADLVMPSKLVGMLASGRPVIAGAAPGTETASIVGHCGIVVEPECAEQIADAIESLLLDPQRAGRLGTQARAYAERVLDSNVIFGQLDARMHALVDGMRPVPERAPAMPAPPPLQT